LKNLCRALPCKVHIEKDDLEEGVSIAVRREVSAVRWNYLGHL